MPKQKVYKNDEGVISTSMTLQPNRKVKPVKYQRQHKAEEITK